MKYLMAIAGLALATTSLWALQEGRTPQQGRTQEELQQAKDIKPGLIGEYYTVGRKLDKLPEFGGMTPTLRHVDPQINFATTAMKSGRAGETDPSQRGTDQANRPQDPSDRSTDPSNRGAGQTPKANGEQAAAAAQPFPARIPKEFFAARWTGVLKVPADGTYKLYLKSDDGSKLYIDGKEVIDNDGTHAADEDSKSIDLKAGDHEFMVAYFNNQDVAVCQVSWEAKDGQKQVIPASAFGHKADKELDQQVK